MRTVEDLLARLEDAVSEMDAHDQAEGHGEDSAD